MHDPRISNQDYSDNQALNGRKAEAMDYLARAGNGNSRPMEAWLLASRVRVFPAYLTSDRTRSGQLLSGEAKFWHPWSDNFLE